MIFKHPNGNRWLIALLVVLNIATLTALFFSRGRRSEHRPDTIGLFRRELDLTEAQAEQFRQFRKTHFEQTKPLFQALRAAQQKMIEHLGDTPADTAAIQNFTAQRSLIIGQIDSLLARHYLDLRAVCTPQQQEKLESIFLRATWPGKEKSRDHQPREHE